MAFRAVAYGLLVFLLCLPAFAEDAMFSVKMPGTSYQGTLHELNASEKTIAANLERHVHTIAGNIGERHIDRPVQLQNTAEYIERQFAALGYKPKRHAYEVRGVNVANIEAELAGSGKAEQILIIGAHYDTIPGSPGANDNTSGVAALLELARLLSAVKPERTLRFVAFVNEEPPFFMTEQMGSRVYARRCKERGERIIGMISLETIGYYSDVKGSQNYPFPLNLFYPTTGNFVGFAANTASASFLKEVIGLFRTHARIPSEGGAVPEAITGIGWSDHWSFWQEGYAALMVTDSALYRYPHYHSANDTPDKLDYALMALVIEGMQQTVRALLE